MNIILASNVPILSFKEKPSNVYPEFIVEDIIDLVQREDTVILSHKEMAVNRKKTKKSKYFYLLNLIEIDPEKIST